MIKDEEPKLGSVAFVLPVYNAGKWLDKCLASLSDQTYKNFVVVCVDDGSTDDSLSILKKWSQKDLRFIVLHQENKGQGSARNLALNLLEKMSADYVAFVDSDDWLDSKFLERMVKKATCEGADITACGFSRVDEKGKIWVDGGFPIKDSLSQFDFINLIFSREEFKGTSVSGGMLWDKLFRYPALKAIRFVEDRSICEDELYILEATLRARRFSLLKENLYFYRQILTSQVHSNGFIHKLLKGRMKCVELVRKTSKNEDYITIVSAFANSAISVIKSGDDLKKNEKTFLNNNIELIWNCRGVKKSELRKLNLYINNPDVFKIYMMFRKFISLLKCE